MPVYNVAVEVVHRIEAATPERAEEALRIALRNHGFDDYDNHRPEAVFESEADSPADKLPAACRRRGNQ